MVSGEAILGRRGRGLSEDKQPRRSFFIWLRDLVYTKLGRVIKRFTDRVYFTEAEVEYLIDIVDVWIEGHRDLEPDDDELVGVYENFAIATDVRNKLWRQLNER